MDVDHPVSDVDHSDSDPEVAQPPIKLVPIGTEIKLRRLCTYVQNIIALANF